VQYIANQSISRDGSSCCDGWVRLGSFLEEALIELATQIYHFFYDLFRDRDILDEQIDHLLEKEISSLVRLERGIIFLKDHLGVEGRREKKAMRDFLQLLRVVDENFSTTQTLRQLVEQSLIDMGIDLQGRTPLQFIQSNPCSEQFLEAIEKVAKK